MGVHQRATEGEDTDTAIVIAANGTHACATPEKKEGSPFPRVLEEPACEGARSSSSVGQLGVCG